MQNFSLFRKILFQTVSGKNEKFSRNKKCKNFAKEFGLKKQLFCEN